MAEEKTLTAAELIVELQKLDPTKVHSILAVVITDRTEKGPDCKRSDTMICGSLYDLDRMTEILTRAARDYITDIVDKEVTH
jgi:hypothetical protein